MLGESMDESTTVFGGCAALLREEQSIVYYASVGSKSQKNTHTHIYSMTWRRIITFVGCVLTTKTTMMSCSIHHPQWHKLSKSRLTWRACRKKLNAFNFFWDAARLEAIMWTRLGQGNKAWGLNNGYRSMSKFILTQQMKLPIVGRSQWDEVVVFLSRTTVWAAEKPERTAVTTLLLVYFFLILWKHDVDVKHTEDIQFIAFYSFQA